MSFSIDATYGAVLVGGSCAAFLSGVVSAQTVLYIKLFPRDSARLKAMVGAVWILDVAHNVLASMSLWFFFIANFGDVMQIDTIPIPLALTGVTTAISTLIVHCFFAHRIHKLSGHKWRFTALILVLAFLRLGSGLVTTAEMIRFKTLTAFKAGFGWGLTLGLAMSCLVDILITGFQTRSLLSLWSDKRASTSLDCVMDTIILYTFETNMLTSAVAVVAMICWLTMQTNLVYLGIYFSISKLYANSLLATLNTRKQLEHQRQLAASTQFLAGSPPISTIPRKTTGKFSSCNESPTKLEINVVKMVESVDNMCSPAQGMKWASVV